MQDLFEFINARASWQDFYDKEVDRVPQDERLLKQINRVLEKEYYLDYTKDYVLNIPAPTKKEIRHYNTSKVRIVYVYPSKYRLILKLVAFYIMRNYNFKFSRNSIAYQEGKSVRTAFRLLKGFNIRETDVVYKNDFSDYFNSIKVDLIEGRIKDFFGDGCLYSYIMQLLRKPEVVINKKIVLEENKGVMAGSPIAGILANVFMHEVDMMMWQRHYKYIRYADDTLIIGHKALEFFKEKIKELDVVLNPKKQEIMNIRDGITFLGFKFQGNVIDLSDKAVAKMKSRMKRRAKWYRQWMRRRHVKMEVTLKDYIGKLNLKLFTDQEDSIDWSRWYMPNINTTKSLEFLDQYFIDSIRYLNSGTWSKKKKFYSLTDEDIKSLGYRSLVEEYYRIQGEKKKR